MKFLGQGFRKLEHEQDRQTHIQTDRRDQRYYTAALAGGNKRRDLIHHAPHLYCFRCSCNFVEASTTLSTIVCLWTHAVAAAYGRRQLTSCASASAAANAVQQPSCLDEYATMCHHQCVGCEIYSLFANYRSSLFTQ